MADFLRQNDSPARLEGPFDSALNVNLLSNQDYDRFFGTGGTSWERFYSVYPKATGVIECSRIGFSVDGTQALVYIGRVSHLLAGKGHVVLLERSSGNWRVRRVEGTWMS